MLIVHVSVIAFIFRTNLPKQIMAFEDFPFPDEARSFPHHTVVKKYLEDYAKHHDLEKYIKVTKINGLNKSNESILFFMKSL